MLVDVAPRVEGPHAHLQIPEGPWTAPTWAIERPKRLSTSGEAVCAVQNCSRPAGADRGDIERPTDALCVAHRRRLLKSHGANLDEFIASQAEASPIRAPRGAISRKPTYEAINFASVHPHLAHELRFIVGTNIQRRVWRDPQYVFRVLQAATQYGSKYAVTSLLDFPPVPPGGHGPQRRRAMFPNEQGAQWNDLAAAFPSLLRLLAESASDLWGADVWHARDHGLSAGAKGLPRLAWGRVTCEWLRAALKEYCKRQLQSGQLAWTTLRTYVRGGSLISQFMDQETGQIEPEDLTRSYFLDFLGWVRSEDSTRSDLSAVNTMSQFLAIARELGIEPRLPSTVYLLRGENAVKKVRRPKPLPSDILERFDAMVLDESVSMPPGVRLMLRVYRAVGPRSSECLEMPLDALRHTKDRGYSLEYVQSKTDKLRAVPIPDLLGEDLATHIAWVGRTLGPTYEYMFPRVDQAPRMHALVKHGGIPQPWTYRSFTALVWGLYQRQGITSSAITGEILTGCALHRFRHSIATGLLNEGWSEYEVQEFLGHDSATMMHAYAEINDEKLRAKYVEYVEKSIDITGARQPITIQAAADVERLRDRMVRATLPNGYCTLPEKQNCDFAPSPCLSCKAFFRTTPTFLPIHIRQRDESLRQLDLAREQGRERAADIHERTVRQLDTIITALESSSNDDGEVAAG